MRLIAPLALSALLLLAPLAAAHAAAPARDFETRILHDHNDDSAVVLLGKHGFDTIALDVREARTAIGTPVLVLRLLLNGGCNGNLPSDCPELSEVVRFTADGTEHSIAFKTTDGGATWSGDAVQFVGPMGINDGARFAIEAWVPTAPLGIGPGTVLSDWFVEGYSGDSSADNMPEGVVAGVPDPLEGAFDLGDYTVGSPDIYVSALAQIAEATASAGDEVRFPVDIRNMLSIEQIVDLQALGSPESRIELDGIAVQNVSLAANFTKTVEVVVTAPDASAPVVLVATSGLGGFSVASLSINAKASGNPATSMVDSPDIPSGTSWSHTFTKAGTFAYHNHHTPGQMGTIQVVSSAGATPKETHEVARTDAGFAPKTLTINVGDTVTWTNDASDLLRIMGGYDDASMDHDDGMHDDKHDDEHDDHHGDGPDAKATPGVPAMLLGIALVALAAVRRRVKQ